METDGIWEIIIITVYIDRVSIKKAAPISIFNSILGVFLITLLPNNICLH